MTCNDFTVLFSCYGWQRINLIMMMTTRRTAVGREVACGWWLQDVLRWGERSPVAGALGQWMTTRRTAVEREVACGWCSRSMNALAKNSSNDIRLSGSRCRSPCSNFLQLSDTCTPGGSCTKVMSHRTLNKSLSGSKIKN